MLFDSGADKSFVSSAFRHYLDKKAKKLRDVFLVETTGRENVMIDEIF